MPTGTLGQKHLRDTNQRGKLIVDINVGDVKDDVAADNGKNKAAQELGWMGCRARAEASGRLKISRIWWTLPLRSRAAKTFNMQSVEA